MMYEYICYFRGFQPMRQIFHNFSDSITFHYLGLFSLAIQLASPSRQRTLSINIFNLFRLCFVQCLDTRGSTRSEKIRKAIGYHKRLVLTCISTLLPFHPCPYPAHDENKRDHEKNPWLPKLHFQLFLLMHLPQTTIPPIELEHDNKIITTVEIED